MSIHLNIDTPCHENWDNMQPVKDGRHCMACRKTVVDFSNMTDPEILEYIANAPGEVCGRAEQGQLNRGLRENNFRKRVSWAYIWNMIILLFVFGGKTKAQGGITTRQHTVAKKDIGNKDVNANTKKIFPGIANASIILKGKEYEVSADSAGKFEINFYGSDYNLSPIATEMEAVTGLGWQNCNRLRQLGGAVAVIRRTTIYEKVSRELSDWLPKKDVIVYPNPVNAGNQIQVALQLKEKGQYRFELIDASGRIMWTQNTNLPSAKYKLSIPTQSNWSAGMYWLRVSGKQTNNVYNGKIILQ